MEGGIKPPKQPSPKPFWGHPKAGTGWHSLRGPVYQPLLVLGVELLQVPELDPALLLPRPPTQPLQARLGHRGTDRRTAGQTGGQWDRREDRGTQENGGSVAEKECGKHKPRRCCSPFSPKPALESTAKFLPTFPREEKQALLLQGGDLW